MSAEKNKIDITGGGRTRYKGIYPTAVAWITNTKKCDSIKDFCMENMASSCYTPVYKQLETNGTNMFQMFQWAEPEYCGYIVPLADELAVQEQYTCSESAFLPPNIESTQAPTCFNYMVGDGNCDPACNIGNCGYDEGDCDDAVVCECDTTWLGDGYCDMPCNSTLCSYDYGDCEVCAPQCQKAWQGDGTCDLQCNTAACGFDSAPMITGCVNSAAENFDYAATVDDGSCSLSGTANSSAVRAPASANAIMLPHCDISWGDHCELSKDSDCQNLSDEYCAPGCSRAWIGDR